MPAAICKLFELLYFLKQTFEIELERLSELFFVMQLSWAKKLWSSPFMVKLRTVAAYLRDYGTEGYREDIARRLKILNVVCYLIAFFTFLYVIEHFNVDYELWKPVIWINLFLIVVALAVPFLHRYSPIAGALMIAIAELISLFVIMGILGRTSGVHIQYVALAAAPFVILGLERIKLVATLVLSALILHLLSWFLFPGNVDLVRASRDQLDTIYINAAITTFGIIAATVYYAFRLVEKAKEETDDLLRNILPETVVNRLKEKPGETISDAVENATVLFSDLKGFVPTSMALGPERTVALLNDLMKAFDELAVRNGVEKIKTIGDAYMAASGVPEPVGDHSWRMAHMALDMMIAADETARKHDTELVMRIGIASGPLMAGVIGAKRLTYDIWGDTVNLAARLESSSLPGRIQISREVKDAIAGGFKLESRGAVEIKGMGPLDTWLLGPPMINGKVDGRKHYAAATRDDQSSPGDDVTK